MQSRGARPAGRGTPGSPARAALRRLRHWTKHVRVEAWGFRERRAAVEQRKSDRGAFGRRAARHRLLRLFVVARVLGGAARAHDALLQVLFERAVLGALG